MARKTSQNEEPLVTVGKKIDTIDVRISHRIIQLFSEGLYSSSNKAIEELVSNSFDAKAQNVHVILSPDLRSSDATIVVIDDGEGMDVAGFKQHWVIGRSMRRTPTTSKGRKPIGKFGIGKLATYVLASRLTHICKSRGKYYAATMDYGNIGSKTGLEPREEGIFNEEKMPIPLRTLREKEAKSLLQKWIVGTKVGYSALKLFGPDSKPSWTVAIMSGLTDMGKKVQRGRLKWILSTAMPFRDDFKLFLDGDFLEPSKINAKLIQKWNIGKDIKNNQLGSPCPTGLEPTEDETKTEDSIYRYGLSHAVLGRVTGYVELYADDLSGKSDQIERSNGFFVYVRERMINTDDPGFGIDRNLLRHGTFSRFRMVVHIDTLDEALRSSRESLQQGELYNLARNFLHAVFNLVRNRLVEYDRAQSPGAIISARLSSAPGSLTRMPFIAMASMAIEGKIRPLYTRFPSGLNEKAKKIFLSQIQDRINSKEDMLQTVEFVQFDTSDTITKYDIECSKLQINIAHPFVAAFQEQYAKTPSNLPLEMYAMAEVLTEAHLYQMNIKEDDIRDVLARRDELLRQFVRSSARRTAGMIALGLLEAKDDDDKLELEMRASFEAIGFANVIRIGGSNKPDGTAEAYLPASEDGSSQRYKLGLEAKSGGIVSAKRLGVSGIARHMKDYNCNHHVVIANGFATSNGDDSASVQEIKNHQKDTGKTITLMHIDDLARLVRLIPAKRVGLNRLRELFKTCITPEQSKAWVDCIEAECQETWPYMEILETIWERANKRPNETVEYAAIVTALEFREPPINISKQTLIECCRAMQFMATPNVIFARDKSVELNRRPDLVIADIRAAINDYPESERKTIKI